jgi:hypothetical protein
LAGCAFLKYETKEQAHAALEDINGKHKMEVSFIGQWNIVFKLKQLFFLVRAQL